jgi:hypothetical protein
MTGRSGCVRGVVVVWVMTVGVMTFVVVMMKTMTMTMG